MSDTIEVFSDLILHIPLSERDAAAEELKKSAVLPWTFDSKRSDEARRNAVGDRDVLVFKREGVSPFPAASASLWGHAEGLYVPNVVPLAMGELTHADYNGILREFVDCVVRPADADARWRVDLTKGRQRLSDWMPEDVARKLRMFSASANKSTGSSHPMDRQRWFDFILSLHRAGADLDVDRLERWLNEVERWDEDSAHRLASEFERYLSILEYADQH